MNGAGSAAGQLSGDSGGQTAHLPGVAGKQAADRAASYFTTRADTGTKVYARTSGVYSGDDQRRAELIAERVRQSKAITNA